MRLGVVVKTIRIASVVVAVKEEEGNKNCGGRIGKIKLWKRRHKRA